MATESDLRLVVGLGNPGSEYAGTRHNVGFSLVDEIGRSWRWQEREKALWSEGALGGSSITLCKPLTFMNRSGDAVGPYCRFYKVARSAVLVVQDELDLPLGEVRLKRGGGDGGHNGLKSLTGALGGADYLRLRLGIGRPPASWGGGSEGDPVVSWVLGRFSREEQSLVEQMITSGRELIERVIKEGFEKAQNTGNRRVREEKA